MNKSAQNLHAYIRAVPDFPKHGIMFRDITPLLADADAFSQAVAAMAEVAPPTINVIAGVEARGFIFGAAIAHLLKLPFVPFRKQGKLPHKTLSAFYKLEYSEDSLHAHADAFTAASRVLIIDDVIATGGTLRACADIIEQAGATATLAVCLIELPTLAGRKNYGRPLHSVLKY